MVAGGTGCPRGGVAQAQHRPGGDFKVSHRDVGINPLQAVDPGGVCREDCATAPRCQRQDLPARIVRVCSSADEQVLFQAGNHMVDGGTGHHFGARKLGQ